MESVDKNSFVDDQQQQAWSQEIPNYGNKLLKRLDEFRKTTILYDVCVRADGGEFNAHKVILAACGGVFRTCFVDEKKKMISSECTELNLDCPAQGLKPIMRFAYTGALVITKRNAVATMIAAEVTKMKEVQEICAGIAVKEYGWVVNFSGEKNAEIVEKLGKVLHLHAACFTQNSANGNHTESEDDLPFEAEVNTDFPDHVGTYHKLAIKLKYAKEIAAASKPHNGADQPVGEEIKSKPNDLTKNLKSQSASTEAKNEDMVDAVVSSESSTPKKASPQKPEPPVIVKIEEPIYENDVVACKSPEKTPRKDLPPPSPKVKPRTSVKVKKAAPPPPSPNAAEKNLRSPAPPRPTKQPAKVPPPRPKPPAKKKISGDPDTNQEKRTPDDYDDNLNPFA